MAFKDDEERRAYFRQYNKGWYQRHRERLLEMRRQHKEPMRGLEPLNLPFTKRLLYQLSYIG